MQNQIRNPWRHERAQDLKEERLRQDAFRCDRCQMMKPLPFTVQDGGRYCRRCVDMLSPIEAVTLRSRDAARAAAQPLTPLTLPIVGSFNNFGSVVAISPTSISLARAGASATVTLTGVWFAAADTVTSDDANVTITQSQTLNATRGLDDTNVLTISAGAGASVGSHNLIYNGDTLQPRGIILVR